jgi:hypothetical protein
MNKIIFLCNWGENSSDLKKKYNKLTKYSNNKWKNLEIVDNINEAQWFVLMDNTYDHYLNLDKKKVIGIQREPYINFNIKNFDNYLSYNNYIHLVVRLIDSNMNYEKINNLNIDLKKKHCSAVVSKLIKKSPLEAYKSYKLRINFIKMISRIDCFDIDIFGYNWAKGELGKNYKGALGGFNINNSNNIENIIPNTNKLDGLLDYKYSIAIENCKKNNYISEKFTDCILAGTIPIYYGADNIGDYFPKDSYYTIDIKSSKCLVDLKNILNKPITEKNKKALKNAKDLILNKYNMLESIHKIINS